MKFELEAKKLNIPVDFAEKIITLSIQKGEIRGIVDMENREFVFYTAKELDELIKTVSSSAERISIEDFAKKLKLGEDQTRLIIHDIKAKGRVQGFFSEDGSFFSDLAARHAIIEVSRAKKEIDAEEISRKYYVPQKEVEEILETMAFEISKALKPYSRIEFAALASEVKLPEDFLQIFLRKLVMEKRLDGSLDLVNKAFLTAKTVPKYSDLKGNARICMKCGFQNRDKSKYCVNCGSEIELSKEDLEVQVHEKTTEEGQKALYIFGIFIMFAIIDIAVFYSFPPILIGGLFTDLLICFFLWITWRK